ncbi:MAG: uracil-DNA glycosylase family protein [Methanoregula sp.]
MIVTEQYPPIRRYDENGKMKNLQDIEKDLEDQCKNCDPKSVVPKYILKIFGRKSLDIRNSSIYWTHMIKCFSNLGRDDLTHDKRKEEGHPENGKNIRQSSSQCNIHLQNEINEFENLEFIIPFGQSAMKSICDAIASINFKPSFNPQIVFKKPFYQVITGAPPEGYSVTIGEKKQKTIHILPFYHPSRRNIFEFKYPGVVKHTNIKENDDQKPGSFVKFLRENYRK